jgi:hypothetical protein
MRLLAVLFALTVFCAPEVTAQSTPSPASGDTAPTYNVFATRTITSLIGWFPGAIAGGFIGAHVPRSPCSCDDPALKEFVIGVAIGGSVGAAFGAAAPRLNSHCSFAHRLGLGLLGSAVGTGLGLIPITNKASVVITVPVFSILGAGLSQWPC